jgi:hypothetical protein
MRTFVSAALLILCLGLLPAALAQQSSPQIASISPTTARAGDQITIVGAGFGATQGSGNVWLGSNYGVVASWSDTQIVASVAAGSKSGNAAVLQGGVWSNSANLTVITPNVTSVTPTNAVAGTQITIVGAGFGATQGSGNVWLGTNYGVVASWSDTQIVASVAAGSKSDNAAVLQGGVWSNSITLTVTTPNIASVTPTNAVAGTQITITGSGFGATQGSGNVWLGTNYGVVANWSDTQIVASVASGSKSGNAAVLQGGVWSNSITLTVTTPNIASVTPTNAVAGTQITIIGTGFGAIQGSGNVWLGTNYGVVASWSDTQIVASVASGSKTGNAAVLQGGVWSNSITLTVITPNIISVTPTNAVAGTQITITGTGFGATQGSGNVWLGSNYGVVVNWSDPQIVASVASGSQTGTAAVLQGGVWSSSVVFTISQSLPTPVISSISPNTGGIGTPVTITGTYFGSTQGQSVVTFNGISARISSWSDTSITAKAPSGLSPGPATIIVGVSQVSSNGVQYTVTQPLFVTPNQATLTVGQTRSMQLIDENGVVLSNTTWSFDDNAVAEIIPPTNLGDPTLLQADTVGTTNFTATYGNRTGTAKITVLPAGAPLPIGTVQWSVPPLGSFGISKTIQSVRVDQNTPDLYVEDDGVYGGNGSIRALTADGQQKWVWPSTNQDKFPAVVAADDQGGVIYFANQDTPNQFGSYCYFGRVDETGNETWQYQESNCSEDYAIAPDGTIFLVEDSFQNTQTSVITALDPLTGQNKFTVPLPSASQQTFDVNAAALAPWNPNVLYCSPGAPGVTQTDTMSNHGSISISSDGKAYIPFTRDTFYGDAQPCDSTPDPTSPGLTHVLQPGMGSWSSSSQVQLMIINPDGSHSTQQLDASSASGTGLRTSGQPGFFGMGRAISDGQGGALLTLSFPPALYHVSAGGASKFTLPITPDAPPGNDLYIADSMLLGGDGTAYITGSSTPEAPVDTVLAVDSSSGNVKWSASTGLHPKLSTVAADGSLAFQYELPDFSVHSALADPTGNVSPLFANPGNSDAGPVTTNTFGFHLPSELTVRTWLAYQQDSSPSALVGTLMPLANSERAESGGDAQKQNKPPFCHVHHCVLYVSSDLIVPPPTPPMERDVVYQLATLQNNSLNPIDNPHEIVLFEERIAGSARICDTPYCSNRDDSILFDHGQFKDALSVQLGSSSESWQKFFVDRGIMKVFWKQPDGSFYGTFRQDAKVTSPAVTITQDPPPGS